MADNRSSADTVTELRELLVTYARQETIDPLKALGTFLSKGLAGSLMLGFASVFLALFVLRLLQAETGDALDGNWSVVPYLVTLAIVALFIGLIAVYVKRVADANKRRSQRSDA